MGTKLEIGGGATPTGRGFVNLDILPTADVVVDFEKEKLPYADNEINEFYSSHCLEHVANAVGVLSEVLRTAALGAMFELRLPHWLHPMASCSGHLHVLSDRQVQIWCDQSHIFWPASNKRFKLLSIHYQIDVAFHELRPLFPLLSDEQVAKYIPGCCHEIRCSLQILEK